MPLDTLLDEGASVLWVAAHPDDEFLAGSILARAAIHHGNRAGLVVLTKGEGGEDHTGLSKGEPERLAELRAAEMARVAERYGAELVQASYFNAPLPMSSFPTRQELWQRWSADPQGDPVERVAQAIVAQRPDIVLTFDPTHGCTGHPEHQLASRITTTAVARAAAQPEGHRAEHVFHLLTRHWLLHLVRMVDPKPVDGWWSAEHPCEGHGTCLDFAVEATRLHETQAGDMRAFRRFRWAFKTLGLRRADPAASPTPGGP